ncbi:weak similarity to HMG [Encephalitozoon cuniculi GB-M1]|uniref:Weak similarity to HMG n=2 Tax=Encephalitozoon cuniculi TaxID=6035 RepID=Q8SV86_ENCCU|nr:uncharacterized protein ECU06_1260 [Encephalitozoon cuniculi GB-M1]KMV66022.1 hypothetical protein M970_061230 [Encephalitozoon cuniculi EcunIII-L]CAD25486.2 weak similarity to HMG [Encephalitozoon cuniculi GB-M1]
MHRDVLRFLCKTSTKQRSPYSVFAREFFRENRFRYESYVLLAKAMVEEWGKMQAEEKSVYVEKCNKDLQTIGKSPDGDENKPSDDLDSMKKLRKYAQSGYTHRWEYSGYLFFVSEIFDICCDMNVSPEENVRMFAEMWNQLDNETQTKCRNSALSLWAERNRERIEMYGAHSRKRIIVKDPRPQRDSNPQPSAP